MGVIMQVLIVFIFTVFLTGCGFPLAFESPPPFVAELDTQMAEGKGEEKIKPPAKGKGARRKVHRRNVQDMVIPKPVPKPAGEAEPSWVAELREEVEVKKIGKGRRFTSEERGTLPPEERGTLPPEERMGADLTGEIEPLERPSGPVEFDGRPEKTSSGKVDIIFVVDASNSMNHFLKKVQTTFAGFITALEMLDWQMMFTTADYSDNSLAPGKGTAITLERNGYLLGEQTILKKNMLDYRAIFMDTLRLHNFSEYYGRNPYKAVDPCSLAPGCQGWDEQPLKALQASFEFNRSFFRPGADVATIIFSDSDEGEHTDPEKRTTAQNVINVFQKQWSMDNKKLISYGIIMVPGEDTACMEKYASGSWGGEGVFGTELARLSTLTGGKNYSLCSGSYTPLANQITIDFNK